MITRHSIETAHAFLHQKSRVYQFSTMEKQKEEIEYAVGCYAEEMNKELYMKMSKGRRRLFAESCFFCQGYSRSYRIFGSGG